MPFDAVSRREYLNREEEFAYLRTLGGRKGNVLLVGGRGMGKTELLKQLHRSFFWDEAAGVIPFYYRFQGATLRASSFARDYLGRFVRQALAWQKKDPSFLENMSVPIRRLLGGAAGGDGMFFSDLIEDLRELQEEGEVTGLLQAALSAPVAAAARMGKRVVVMLDDFHLASALHESVPGDRPGLISLFEGSMKASLCPHVLTGSPEEALERIFSEDSFRGRAERMRLGPLPEDTAFEMFRELCGQWGVTVYEKCRGLMRHLGGNPLYIRNMAAALRRMKRQEATVKAFWECYAHEVSEGETAFYWSSVLGAALREPDRRRLALEAMHRSLEGPLEVWDLGRLARAMGVREDAMREALSALQEAGFMRARGGARPVQDTVLHDFIRSAHMLEARRWEPEKARRAVFEAGMAGEEKEETSFEVVIPMSSQAELVAARAAEQICAPLHLKREVVEQLQLAIIEACINAMEHSGSYERKIRLSFAVGAESIEVGVESPGRTFEIEPLRQPSTEEKLKAGERRGWGLQLIRKIVDDVRVERIDGMTRVVLIKKIKPDEVAT